MTQVIVKRWLSLYRMVGILVYPIPIASAIPNMTELEGCNPPSDAEGVKSGLSRWI